MNIKIIAVLFLTVVSVIVFINRANDVEIQNVIETEIEVEGEKRYYIKEDQVVLKIPYENGVFEASISDLPTLEYYLQDYLEPTNSDELHVETDCMIVNKLNTMDSDDYYLLRYGCAIKLRDYLLIKQNQQGIESIYLEFGIFQNAKMSPDQKKLALLFARNERNMVIRSNIVLVGLDKFMIIEPESDVPEYVYPIIDYQWNSLDTLQVSIPDLENYSFEQISEWLTSEEENKRVKELNVKLNDVVSE